MEISPPDGFETPDYMDWLQTILMPAKRCLIPLSYKEKSNKANLDPGCHATVALIATWEQSTNSYLYQVVGFHRADDPSSYDVRSENLQTTKIGPSKFQFKGTIDGGKPFKLTFKHDLKHNKSKGHIVVKWLVDNVPDKLLIDHQIMPLLLRMASSK